MVPSVVCRSPPDCSDTRRCSSARDLIPAEKSAHSRSVRLHGRFSATRSLSLPNVSASDRLRMLAGDGNDAFTEAVVDFLNEAFEVSP